jgi:hypothetical protein
VRGLLEAATIVRGGRRRRRSLLLVATSRCTPHWYCCHFLVGIFVPHMRLPTRHNKVIIITTLRLNLSLSSCQPTAHQHSTRYTSSNRRLEVHVSSWVAPKSWNVTDRARSLLVPASCTRARAAHALHARQPLSAPSPQRPPSCSRTPVSMPCQCVMLPDAIPPRAPPAYPFWACRAWGAASCITGQDLSSVLVETSVYAPSGLL